MILTRPALLKHIKNGDIFISPYEEKLVSINSIDIRLGPELWKIKEDETRDLYTPSDDIWESVCTTSVSVYRKTLKPDFAQGVLADDDQVFILEGGKFYLGTTLEAIGTNPVKDGAYDIVPKIQAKSTIGRQGLTVALCAGLGDVGYKSRWALEIRVTNDNHIAIAPGTPIAQVVFHKATRADVKYDGADRYQHEEEVRFLPKPLKYFKPLAK